MRDELFVQLCKQTTDNTKSCVGQASARRAVSHGCCAWTCQSPLTPLAPFACRTSNELGWQLIIVALNFFPPSQMFFQYLKGYIARHTEESVGRRRWSP